MLMMIGAISFQIAPFNSHAIDYSAETAFAEKAVLGVSPPLEWVGEGASAWTVNGRLFPRSLGGLTELERLQDARRSGREQYMVRGDGKAYGYVVITGVQERATYLDEVGVGKQIDVTIAVRRAGKPSDGSFFALMQGLLG